MIRVTVEGGVATIALDRPEKANALTRAMLLALDDALARIGAQEAGVLVITGAGRVFSAGADLGEMAGGLGDDPVWGRVSGRIAKLGCLTIAALNGTAAGGALGMVLACDLRIAAPGAEIFYPVMRRGYLPQPDDPARLVALVGPARAKMILMAGVRVTTDQALAWGLVDRLDEDVLATAKALAADVLAARPGHAAAIKAMIRAG